MDAVYLGMRPFQTSFHGLLLVQLIQLFHQYERWFRNTALQARSYFRMHLGSSTLTIMLNTLIKLI